MRMPEYMLDNSTEISQHKSEVHPGLRVYKYCPDTVAVQIRGTRGKIPTYAVTQLEWQQVAELRDYLTDLLNSEERSR